jgi:RNase P subunit RPR2
MMLPRKPDAVTLEALKKRIENERIVLQCLYCNNKRRYMVRDLPERIKWSWPMERKR